VDEHVLVNDIQSIQSMVSKKNSILSMLDTNLMFSYREVGQKICNHRHILLIYQNIIRNHVDEHVLVNDIQSIQSMVSKKNSILSILDTNLMFSYREVGQKICNHGHLLFSLPVGYFHAADCPLIWKCNLEPGLELIVLRVKIASVTLGGFPVEGEPWIVVLTLPVHARGTGNAGDTGIS
jgi:hypothetical protein